MITIDQPVAPNALPMDHPLRRTGPRPTKSSNKTGSARFYTRARQDLAAAYYDEKEEAKYLRAYVKTSNFMLRQLIERLDRRTESESGKTHRNAFRLQVAKKALKMQVEAGRLPLPAFGDIPEDSPRTLRVKFLKDGIGLMTLWRNLSTDPQWTQELSDQIKAFEAALAQAKSTQPAKKKVKKIAA